MMKSRILTVLLLVFTAPAFAAQFKYNELMIKDYDEMSRMVQAKIKKARSVGSNSSDENVNDAEAVEHLREAVKLIFSRPNSDNMIAKLMPEVRKELVGYSAFEDTISGLTAEALETVKNKKAATSHQATALFMLENILSEIRPEAERNEDLRRVVQRVKDANVKITSDVTKDLKLRGMFKTKNPSDLAEEILKSLPKIVPKKADPKKSEADEE